MKMKKGVVIILDLLGGKLEDRHEVDQFIKVRNEMKENFIGKATKSAEIRKIELEADVYTFGDSIIYALSHTDDTESDDVLRSAILATRQSLAYAISKGYPFRGALSYGKFYTDNDSNTVLGPAVNDAASWYDQTEIIGVIATPSATLKILSDHELDAERKPNKQKFCFITKVPNKFKYDDCLGYVNWPAWIAFNEGNDLSLAYSKILTFLSAMKQPPKTENKYNNTIELICKIFKIKSR
jgi:hypothetical protein